MRTIVKVEIQTYQISYMAGVLYMESKNIAIRMGILCGSRTQQSNGYMNGKHRNAELDSNKR